MNDLRSEDHSRETLRVSQNVSIQDLDEYTLRQISAILHLQGISRHIDSRFSEAVDEWRDVRALRATCKDFARAIGAPRVSRITSFEEPSAASYISTSRTIRYIIRERFSAQSIERCKQILNFMTGTVDPNGMYSAAEALGSKIDNVMRSISESIAPSKYCDWRAIYDAIMCKLGMQYVFASRLANADDRVVIAQLNHIGTILLHMGDVPKSLSHVARKLLDKYLTELMLAYGIRNAEHERICDLLETCDPTSVRVICCADFDEHSDELLVHETRGVSSEKPNEGRETIPSIIIRSKWAIHNFRAILETNRETMRERCVALFAQFPDIDIRSEKMSEIDRVALFLQDNPIRDIMVEHMFAKFGAHIIKYLAYDAMFSPFIKYEQVSECLQHMATLLSGRDDSIARTMESLCHFSLPCQMHIMQREDGSDRYVISITHTDTLDQLYDRFIHSTMELARDMIGITRRMTTVKSLCALYLMCNCDVARMFAQLPREIDVRYIIMSIQRDDRKIASYGIDASEMLRKFCDFRAKHFAA